MGHSYIDFGDRNVLLHDDDIATLFSIALALSKQSPDSNSHELAAMLEEWNSLLDTAGPGCFNVTLDPYLTTPGLSSEFMHLIDHVEDAIAQLPDIITAEDLGKLIRPRVVLFADGPTQYLLAALQKIRSLFLNEPEKGVGTPDPFRID